MIDCGQGTTGSWTTPYLRRGPQSFWLIAEDFNGNRAEPVKVNWNVGRHIFISSHYITAKLNGLLLYVRDF